MILEFLKDHDRFKKGSRARILRIEALRLIAKGIAKVADLTNEGHQEDVEDISQAFEEE